MPRRCAMARAPIPVADSFTHLQRAHNRVNAHPRPPISTGSPRSARVSPVRPRQLRPSCAGSSTHRRQLLRRAIRLRRPDARRDVALHRTVRLPCHACAGAARTGFRRFDRRRLGSIMRVLALLRHPGASEAGLEGCPSSFEAREEAPAPRDDATRVAGNGHASIDCQSSPSARYRHPPAVAARWAPRSLASTCASRSTTRFAANARRLAPAPGDPAARPESDRGGPGPLCRTLRPAGEDPHAAFAGAASGGDADLQHPRGRQADRRAARRRDAVPHRPVLPGAAGDGLDALRHRGAERRRQHAVRQRLHGL